MKSLRLALKAILLFGIAGTMMGNQSCQQKPQVEERKLRRRVAMGGVEVNPSLDTIPLPAQAGGGQFNFTFAANGQLQMALRDSKTFSAANGFYDPSTVTAADKAAFYECSSSNKISAFAFSDEAVCMVNQPLAKISARVIDFRFNKGVNVSLGFGDLLKYITGLSASFDSAKLTMDFYATNPLLPGPDAEGFVIGAVENKTSFKSVGGKVNFSFAALGGGLGGYYSSDMSNVMKQALEDGFGSLKTQWDQKDSDYGIAGGWYAMVMKNCDKGILINAGNDADAGLKKGDILAIYPVSYDWYGGVCNSKLRGMIQDDQPVAYARVTTTADTISRAEIIENDPNYPHIDGQIKPGSRVYMKAFAPQAAATTK